jgi:hypothetical protein
MRRKSLLRNTLIHSGQVDDSLTYDHELPLNRRSEQGIVRVSSQVLPRNERLKEVNRLLDIEEVLPHLTLHRGGPDFPQQTHGSKGCG